MGSGYLKLEGSQGKKHQKLDVCQSIDLTCLSSVTQLSTDSVDFFSTKMVIQLDTPVCIYGERQSIFIPIGYYQQ